VATQKKNSAISPSQKINKQINVPQNQIAQTSNTNKNNIDQSNEKSINNQKTNEFNQILPNQITNESQIAQVETKAMNPTVKVNASYLLSEVDNELELSFREKVIRKIDKNYKTVKVALANRNQQ
jgi:hypothetical protein